ncbi:MAG: phosphoesterase [Micavibrio aeruginosavorus]|uniref:Phosphoesterase n=1 Tax=Micavibrio aeruginosavorus TaxID=349221 RepID=A0A2W5HJK5_9BACT|nr:MAG: phosphoesterase [Micavibrio aeruginosavorus]
MKIPSIEPVILFSLTLICAMIWGFWEIAEDVTEGDTHSIDTSILLMMRDAENREVAWGPVWFAEMMRDISSLGSMFVLSLFTLCSAVYLYMTKHARRAAYLVAAVIAGTILSNSLKLGFDRPRPDLVPHATETLTSSFPSSHSMMSAIVYLILGALLAQAQASRKLKIYFLSIAVFLTLIVGISRIYLGVHWPSDVMAGWLAGLVFACAFWTGERWLLKRAQGDNPA